MTKKKSKIILVLLRIREVFISLFFDPWEMLMKWKALPSYLQNIFRYKKNHHSNVPIISLSKLYYTTYEKFMPGGTVGGHYFLQDIWASKKIYEAGINHHVDVGSRIDGFVAHILPFCQVDYIDIREIDSPFSNLIFKKGSILALPYEKDSIASLSCLHVIEHIGLGRYGDPIDPHGHIKASAELVRVLQPGGKLLIGTPVGKESLYFDAHRVFFVESVLQMFSALKLESFSFIDDEGKRIIDNPDTTYANNCKFGCGLFVFSK
jgi:SAM-dependent methyltransferase